MGSLGSVSALRPAPSGKPEARRSAGYLVGLPAWPTRADRPGRPDRPDRPIRARNSVWLAATLDQIWEDHFWDVPRITPVHIRFGGRWKYRLGRIRWEAVTQSTLIAINALFRDPIVPKSLCRVTIAHEIIHYAHGFGSPLPRLYEDPHEPGVIERELEARGLGRELTLADAWAERHWLDFHAQASRRATVEAMTIPPPEDSAD